MESYINLKISLPNQENLESIQCFAVFCNCRVNLPFSLDADGRIVSIKTKIGSESLIVVETPRNFLEIDASR